MLDYNKDDLVENDYANTTTRGDNPNYTSIRNKERVNEKELYEVVYFCDAFVKAHNVPKNKESFQKVEQIIRLPGASYIVMRKDLNYFVEDNWAT